MIATLDSAEDLDLVEAVRAGDDAAFEELYGRYRPRIAAFVRGMLRDEARAEDVAQETFLSALRRLRETDSEINFKPWIYQIARNAAIDSHRRRSRAEEISMDSDAGLRPSDQLRLVGGAAPESALVDRERLAHLCGAFDELPDVQSRALVMRELEGMSYREIGDELDLTRPAVESALFRARRRLETEYADISEGRRCAAMRTTIARLAEGVGRDADERRLGRHARRCTVCRRRARELGVEPMLAPTRLRDRIAALLPLPGLPQFGAFVSEKAVALAAIAAVAGAGGAALTLESQRGGGERPAVEQRLFDRDGAPPAGRAPLGSGPGESAGPRGRDGDSRGARARSRGREDRGSRDSGPRGGANGTTGGQGGQGQGAAGGSAGGLDVPGTAGSALGGAGSGVGQLGSGVGQGVGQLGSGVGSGVGRVGSEVGSAVGETGSAVGDAVGEVGAGVGNALPQAPANPPQLPSLPQPPPGSGVPDVGGVVDGAAGTVLP